jgi:hypothetical protein
VQFDIPISLSVKLAISMLCCAFAFLHTPYNIVSMTFKPVTLPLAICFRCYV